ncbi:MAG: hypothetical protein GY943_01205 [Chloroflexi bacterium]|nr:hypothetical protein [Chloroflexota bacterium]
MKRWIVKLLKVYRTARMLFHRLFLFFSFVVIFLTSCAVVQPIAPLPTHVPTAEVLTPSLPSIDQQIMPEVPTTFTPSAIVFSEPTPNAQIVVQERPLPSATPLLPTATKTVTAVPSPPINPIMLTPLPVTAVYQDQPPRTIECSQHGMLIRSQFPSDFGGPMRDYHAYLPPCYGEDGRVYPTLYLFHGSIQTDTHWVDLGLIQHIEKGIREQRYPPFIVIMPFNDELGNITSGGENSIEEITINSLMPYVETHFCSWNEANGRSIGGISRGGYWALMIAFRHTDLFTAVAGHSSHLRYETDKAEYNPLSTYETADLSTMRIWLDWGKDGFLRVGQMQLHDALIDIGADLQATVNPGGHNDEYWLAQITDYLDWHTAVWPLDRATYPTCN